MFSTHSILSNELNYYNVMNTNITCNNHIAFTVILYLYVYNSKKGKIYITFPNVIQNKHKLDTIMCFMYSNKIK